MAGRVIKFERPYVSTVSGFGGSDRQPDRNNAIRFSIAR